MRTTLVFAALASAAAMMLLQCASHDDSGSLDERNDPGESADAQADTDAQVDANPNADASDASGAATQDEFDIPDASVACDASPCAVALEGAGQYGTDFCARMADKTVQCWGANYAHQAGYDSSDLWLSAPRRLNLSGIVNMRLSADNGCVLDDSGSVSCWGVQDLINSGMAPDASAPLTDPALPTRLDLVPPASALSLGLGTACVTTTTGSISCWGKNESGQLARAATTWGPPSEIPIRGKAPLTAWPYGWAMFATTGDGKLYSWGRSICPTGHRCDYLIGRESSEDYDIVPGLVPTLSNVRAVSTTGASPATAHFCAIAGRDVWCWGANTNGELGTGVMTAASQTPVRTILSEIVDADDVDAGRPAGRDVPMALFNYDPTSTCAIMASGRIYCWGGFGDSPQFGVPRSMTTGNPAIANAPSDLVSLAYAYGTACALRRSGEVDCWGANFLGLLGQGNDDFDLTTDQPTPVQFEQ